MKLSYENFHRETIEMSSVFIAAAVQMTSGPDKPANLKKAQGLLEKGVDAGAALLSLPENFSFMGGDREKLKAAERIEGGESIDFLKNFAAKYKVWLHGGSIPIRNGDDKVYNTTLLIDDRGGVAARYDKIHLFDVSLKDGESHEESRFVQRGDRIVTVRTPFGKVGLSICYDLRFPELYRKMTLEGAGIIFSPAAFTVGTGMSHWSSLVRARAIENQIYMIAPAQFGLHGAGRRTYGNSMIVDPWGTILAAAPEYEAVITAEIDLIYQKELRKSLPCLGHIIII